MSRIYRYQLAIFCEGEYHPRLDEERDFTKPSLGTDPVGTAPLGQGFGHDAAAAEDARNPVPSQFPTLQVRDHGDTVTGPGEFVKEFVASYW